MASLARGHLSVAELALAFANRRLITSRTPNLCCLIWTRKFKIISLNYRIFTGHALDFRLLINGVLSRSFVSFRPFQTPIGPFTHQLFIHGSPHAFALSCTLFPIQNKRTTFNKDIKKNYIFITMPIMPHAFLFINSLVQRIKPLIFRAQ